MSSILGVQDALDRLGQLRLAVRDAVARRDALDRDLQSRRHRDQYDTAGALRDHDAAVTARIAEHEAASAAVLASLRARTRARLARIQHAKAQSLRRAEEIIAAEEGERTFRIQQGLLQASRTHDAALPAARKANDAFNADLKAAAVDFDVLDALAVKSFAAFGGLPPSGEDAAPAAKPDAGEHALMESFQSAMAETRAKLERFRAQPLSALFRVLPPPVFVALLIVGFGGWAAFARLQLKRTVELGALGLWLGISLAAMGLLFGIAWLMAKPVRTAVMEELAGARRLRDDCAAAAARNQKAALAAIEREFNTAESALKAEWTALNEEIAARRAAATESITRKAGRALAGCERLGSARVEAAAALHQASLAHFQSASNQSRAQLQSGSDTQQAAFDADYTAKAQQAQDELDARARPVYEALGAAVEAAAAFPAWEPGFHERWTAPAGFAHVAPFGRLEVDVAALAEAPLNDGRLVLPGPDRFYIPALLAFPRNGSILFETSKSGRDESIAALNNIVLRLLAGSPAARVSFSLIDSVGLGQSFAGVTHLSDFGESLIHGRIWTQSQQIEKRLAELNEHMEKVIQVYLRNEYATIADYNEKAGTIAEKYHFLVIADFPANFSETAIKRLLSIAANGPRCGVFTLMHWDRRQPLVDVTAEDLRDLMACVTAKDGGFALATRFAGVRLVVEPPPDAASVTAFIQKVGEQSLHASRVEVPFDHIAPQAGREWSLDTSDEMRVPIGRTGATKLQYLELGQGTRQHALVAGKTGSGKSTLFHVLITNLSLWCSPEQVEFYLVDFKKGVEFQCYAQQRLPHARVVAIESDREFGLSVLQRLDEELRRRGELFRRAGAQDLPGYRRSPGAVPLPRTLLLIDEFQEFFTEDDRVAQSAALLLDRIVRQGRAFGIHVVLGSQTLGGAYTLARATLGQMVVRIALQCNEADAYLIMDENNPAPRMLTRPGEGIYNDMAGAIEGNSPFQAVWLDEGVRERRLKQARERARSLPGGAPNPIVFEGNAPAAIGDNDLLRAALGSAAQSAPATVRAWLGAPNSIKGPTEAVFARQSGSNLLLVGQREEASQAIVAVALLSLAAQFPRVAARFVVLDASAPGTPERDQLDRLCRLLPHEVTLARGGEVETALASLSAECKERAESGGTGRPEVFLFILGLPKFKRLRFEEDFGFGGDASAVSPGKLLNDLICEGPAVGVHVVAVCDTNNNVNRFLSRRALSEFDLRVLFQMSANDSAALCDSQRAANLGLHRAVFFNEQEGYLEVFRPYAMPDGAWLEDAGGLLAQGR